MTDTPNLALPLLAAAQAQKHVTHNEALFAIDALLQCAVLDKDLAAPPASPAEGARYIVGAAPTGAWVGHAGQLAWWQDGAWQFFAPKPGFIAFVLDESLLYFFGETAWTPLTSALSAIQNLSLLGIGTSADAANPFSAKLNKALWVAKTVAEGGTGDLRYTLSKETSAKVLSFLLQTNFSGRAEVGLIGDDNLSVKVSPDGATFVTSLTIDKTTGKVKIPKIRPAGLFSVNRNGVDQTGWAATGYQKIQFTNEEVDRDNWFDSTGSYRFQPIEAGYYLLCLGTYMGIPGSAPSAPACQIAKNGTAVANGAAIDFSSAVVSAGGSGATAIVPLNGTTDYVEFRIYVSNTGNTLFGPKHLTFANGCKVADL